MAKISDKQQQAKANQELKERFDRLKLSIGNNLDELSQLANDIPMDNFYHLVDYIVEIKTKIGKMANYRNIYILEFLYIRTREILSKASNDNFVKLEIMEINSLLDNYQNISQEFVVKLHEYFDGIYQDASLQVSKFAELNDIYKNYKTYEIYEKSERLNDTAYKKYIKRAIWFAIGGFILSILISLIFTQCFFEKLCILKYDMVDYWVARVSILLIAITGVTFCLKQSIHHQKKKDKAEQTRLELEALPTYMFNFSDEQKSEVYKELTGKYFGRDFDNEGYKDMANLIQEQIRLSHEVLKDTLLKNSNATSTKKGS